MRPLLFLTARSVVNGIRRSLTSSRRLISLIIFVAYYIVVVMRPMNSSYSEMGRNMPTNLGFNLPPIEVLQALAFAGFAILSLILMLGMTAQRLAFRPADVDVLFPTPLDPRIVLIFRLIRDYMLTLLIPLLFIILGWRPTASGLEGLIHNLPHHTSAGYVFRVAAVAWVLMALAWVAIGYAVSLFVNRSDLISDRNRRVLTIGGVLVVLLIGAYVALKISRHPSLDGFVGLTTDPVIRVVFFTATAASTMVMAPLEGNWLPFYTSAGGLLAITFGAVLIALSQVGWMYDQAAARGFDSLKIRRLQQRGDFIAIAAERARTGKVKARSWRWLATLRVRGPWAIVWRETITQIRTSPVMILLFAGLGIMFGLIPIIGGEARPGEAGWMLLLMQTMTVFIGSMSISQSGFIEVLRRVDFEKPLPFSPSMISFAEIAAKGMPAFLSITLSAAVCFVVKPELWPFCLASVVGLPLVSVLFCAVVFLVTVLFPDVDDPTQRSFRGLMILLGVGIVMLPVGGMALAAGFLARELVVAPVIAAAVAGVASLLLSALVSFIAGSFYAQFNPSE